MDALAGLLDGPRARGAFLLRAIFDPPWSMRVQDRAPLSLAALVRGEAWVTPQGADPVRLGPGDVAIHRGPDPYDYADRPGAEPDILIDPGQECVTPDGVALVEEMTLGLRSWGNAADGATMMLVGTYETPTDISRRLLGALPPFLVLRADDWRSPLVPLLGEEIVRDELGQEAVLDKLLDLLLISALRTWFGRAEARPPAWYRAQSDAVVGRALRLLHNNPAVPWTVASLATAVGVSRAGLARRFTDLVGEPPMAYLTDWRLTLAADLLRERDSTVASVARRVGYGSPFALSAAFKRVRGMSPQEHRATAA